MSPPVIPGLTQLSPGTMRAILRGEMGSQENADIPEKDEQEDTPQGILAESLNLFWKAGEFGGLQDVIMSALKALVKASPQRQGMMASPLRMPVSMPPQVPEQATMRDRLMSELTGGSY